MGSLMAGWDSNTSSSSLERNRSLTNEEIDAFWKSKKEMEEDHIKAISNLSRTIQPGKYEDSVPLALRMKETLGMNGTTNNLEQLITKNGWWTKSNWAFLNEPPLMETSSNKYASQFHVANAGSLKQNPGGHGISALSK